MGTPGPCRQRRRFRSSASRLPSGSSPNLQLGSLLNLPPMLRGDTTRACHPRMQSEFRPRQCSLDREWNKCEAFLRLFATLTAGAGSFKSRNGILNGEIVMRKQLCLRDASGSDPWPASISDGGPRILPVGSIRVATIEALPKSMRRSRAKRSATQRRNRTLLRSSSGENVVLR